MGFYTDSTVLATFPSAASLTTDQLKQAVPDTTAVYNYALSNPGTSEAKLRNWGEGQGIDPDRMTIALGLLQDSGMLYLLPDPGPIPSPDPQNPMSATAPKRTSTRRTRETKGKSK